MKINIRTNDDSFEQEENTTTKVRRELELITRFVRSYDDMSDEERYDILNHFFDFRLDNIDLVSLARLKTGKKFTKMVLLPTKMESEYAVRDEYKAVNDKIPFKVQYECATLRSFEPKKKKYTRNELLELISKGKIYPVLVRFEAAHGHSDNSEGYEELDSLEKEFNLVQDSYDYTKRTYEFESQDASLMMKLIDGAITRYKIFSGLKTYLKRLLEESLSRHDNPTELADLTSEIEDAIDKVKARIPRHNKKASHKKDE